MEFITTKWFREEAPQNANEASINIGTGTNGVITIKADAIGIEGNDYTITGVIATGANKAMTATLSGKDITLTLGTGADSNVASASNTATLIATAINALAGVNAVKSGTGADSISQAFVKTSFTGGLYGTVAPIPYTYWKDANYYYVNIAPNGTHDRNWRRFQLATY